MKKVLTLILLCGFFDSINSQNIKAHFTHEVEYVILSRNSANTLTIAFDKTGRYLWTKYDKIARDLAKNTLKGMNLNATYFDSNILFDSDLAKIYLDISFGENRLFLNFSLADILPMGADSGIDETLELNAIKTDSTYNLNNKLYPKYKLVPSSKPKNSIMVAFDDSKGIDSSETIKKIIALILAKTDSKGDIIFNVPKGLILSIQDSKGKNVVSAIKSTQINKTLEVNYNLKITQ